MKNTSSARQATTVSPGTKRSLRFLLSLVRSRFVLFAASVALSVLAEVAHGPGLAAALKLFTGAVLAGNPAQVAQAARAFVLMALVMALGMSLGSYALCRLSEDISSRLRTRILGRILRAPCPYLDSRTSSDVVSCITNDVESAKQAFAMLQQIVANVISLGISLTVLFSGSPAMALTVLAMALLCGLSGALFAGPVKRVSDVYQANLARITERATAIFTGLGVIKSLEKEAALARRFGELSNLQYRTGTRRGKILGTQESASNLAAEISSLLLFLVAGFMSFAGKITPGEAVGLAQLSSVVLWPLAYLGSEWANLHQSLAGLDRVINVLEAPQENYSEDPGAGEPMTSVQPDAAALSFEEVSFQYSPEKQVLRGVSFEVPAGRKAVIVGPSGSGKSTLARILLRFYDPQEGRVTLFGRDIRSIPLRRLRGAIALVPQDPWIFPGTVKENILFGNPHATVEDVIRASKAAQAHDFISGLPGGYDHVLEERGKNLSGGQKQRICLARALLKRAPVLFLDEPTAAVDAESERLINEAIGNLGHDRTVIVVSHTPEMKKGADLVFTVKDGRVADFGMQE